MVARGALLSSGRRSRVAVVAPAGSTRIGRTGRPSWVQEVEGSWAPGKT